jgi:hypothetical protein
MDLIVTEFLPEAEFYFSNRSDLLTKGAKVLSLLPEASLFWTKKGVAFETSVPYFPKSSHEHCLESVDKMIRRVNGLSAVEDANGIRHAYTNALTFYLRQYLSYVAFSIETVANFIERHPGGKLHAVVYQGIDVSQYALLAKERILGELLRKFEGRIAVETSTLKVPGQTKPDVMRRRMRSLFCRAAFEWELKKIKTGPAAVFYSLKYNFDHVARGLKGSRLYNVEPDRKTFLQLVDRSAGLEINQIHLPDLGGADEIFERTWQRLTRDIRETHRRETLFTYRGIDFSDVIFRKIDQGYAPELRRLNRRTASLKRFLKKLKPAVVLSPMARDLPYALGELSSQMNIPSILISHGSHVPPQNSFDRMEWEDHGKGLIHTDYRYHLLQSPWAVEHVRSMGYHGQYHRIRPLIFPEVDRAGKDERQLKMLPQAAGKKILLHAGTAKPRGSNRLYIYETLDEYVEYIRHLIEATASLPDVFLVVRFRPYSYLSTAQLKALLPPGEHYTVASEGSFEDYLKIADLLVSFSSTTIEEALINRIPVLQYDASNRYAHIDGVRCQDKGFAHVDSVYYIGDRGRLRPGLQWIVDNHLKSTTIGDLFERHVFASGEAVRAEEFIERMLKNDLPAPVVINEKKHLDLGEVYDS